MHSRALSALVDEGDDDSAGEVQNLPAPAAGGGGPEGAPRGGLDTGLGGTAGGDDTLALLGLASGVVLLTAGGGVVAARRRT